MSRFMKDFIVYEGKTSKVYINQYNNPGKKTKLFLIKVDNKKYIGVILGRIKFDGAWRQYVSEFSPGTVWSAGCKRKVAEFEDILNKQFRDKIKKRNQ